MLNKIILRLRKQFKYFPANTTYSIKQYLQNINKTEKYHSIQQEYAIQFEQENKLFADFNKLQFPEIFYAELSNIILFKDFEFFASKTDSTLFFESNPYKDHFYTQNLFDSYNSSLKQKHYIINQPSTFIKVKNNYYHFYFDTLLRIIYYKQNIDPKVSLYIDNEFTNWQKEILNILKLDEINYSILPKSQNYIYFKHFFHISFSGIGAGIADYKAIKLLNEQLTININSNNPQNKVYLSRNNAKHRKVENEKELIALLEKYNVQTIYIEDVKSIEQQYQIFANAKLIIAVHGASLTNLLITKNISVVEFINEQHTVASYSHIANCLNNKYTPLPCLNVGKPDMINKQESFVLNNIKVNIEQLENIIKTNL